MRRKATGGYRDKRAFLQLTRLNLKTARAWRIEEAAGMLRSYRYRGVAERNWKRLVGWISRCRLQLSMIKVGRTVRRYLWGIINAIILGVTNAAAESISGRIRKIKAMACGFCNRARFRIAILFHTGGLSMLPAVG